MDCKNQEELDKIYKELNKSIIYSAKSTCPRRKRTMGFKGNPWWNEECKKIIKGKNKIRKIFMQKLKENIIRNLKQQCHSKKHTE